MKGYKIGTDLYIFSQEAGEIPYVAEDVTKIYIQYEQLEAFKEDNADYADIMIGYNYYTMSVNKKDWAGHAGDDIVVPKTDPDLAWSATGATVTIGVGDNVFPTLTNTDNVEVTYASSATGVATIGATGAVALVDAGETTISAAFAGDSTYNAKTVSYDLTVQAAAQQNSITAEDADDNKILTTFSFYNTGTMTLNKPESEEDSLYSWITAFIWGNNDSAIWTKDGNSIAVSEVKEKYQSTDYDYKTTFYYSSDTNHENPLFKLEAINIVNNDLDTSDAIEVTIYVPGIYTALMDS